MIDPEQFRQRTGVTPPSLFQWVVDVPPTWLARARAAVPRPCPRGWPERLAQARWVSSDDAQELLDALGVWPAEDLISFLACGAPVTAGVKPRRRSDPVTAVDAFSASAVGFAILLLSRLGVPVPADELLAPLKRRLARETLLNDAETHLHRWTSTRERRVSVFLWLSAGETSGAEWTCHRLHDGRAAYSFRSRFGFPTQVIARPDVHRDLGLSLLLAGAPADLASRVSLYEVAQSAPPAGPSVRTEKPMETLRRLVREVHVRSRNPDQPRQSRD